MLKLRIINKPKMYKLKCNFAFPNIILANMQEKEVTPTKEIQEVVPDIQYDGLSKVTVNPIPDEYIIPKLGSKQITENGIYKASDDNLDGYSSVEVATSGVDINDYFDTSKYFPNAFSHYLGAAVKKIPYFDSSKNDKFEAYFYYLENLIELPLLDYSKGTSFVNFCKGCSKLQTIDISTANCSKVKNSAGMFSDCSSLIKLIINNPVLFPMTHYNMLQSTPIEKGTGYVYVPDDMVDTYKSATNWSTYASQIKGMSELV